MGTEFLGLIIFAVSQVSTPGPANMALLASGAAFGLKRAIPFVLGVVCGKQIIIWPIGFGFITLMDQYTFLFEIMKWVSCAYILWLAFNLSKLTFTQNSSLQTPPTFTQGLILHPMNPKAWAMVLASFSSFTNQDNTTFLSTAIIASLFFLCQLFLHPLWCWSGEKLSRFASKKNYEKWIVMLLAGLMALSILFVL